MKEDPFKTLEKTKYFKCPLWLLALLGLLTLIGAAAALAASINITTYIKNILL